MREKELNALGRLLDVMDELREKCPWDREQTFLSLRNNTIEETYELADAILEGDPQQIRTELGDLLLHVVFYSKIGQEEGNFDIGDVANGISDKLVFRHPHVFGQVDADSPEKVMQNWEQLKLVEKKDRKGVLSGVPKSLPAMVKAFRIGQKAASAGFDWNKREDVWEKVAEEIREVSDEIKAGDKQKTEEEFGDLFFALVNAARLYGVDPELALEMSNKKFIRRFNALEEQITSQGKSLKDSTLKEMDAVWNDIKKEERGNH